MLDLFARYERLIKSFHVSLQLIPTTNTLAMKSLNQQKPLLVMC
jgi:hypothetical protein